jgi:hypothetical protein
MRHLAMPFQEIYIPIRFWKQYRCVWLKWFHHYIKFYKLLSLRCGSLSEMDRCGSKPIMHQLHSVSKDAPLFFNSLLLCSSLNGTSENIYMRHTSCNAHCEFNSIFNTLGRA